MMARLFGVIGGCFLLGALAMYKANQRVEAPIKRSRWIKYLTYAVIVHGVILCALAGSVCFMALMAVIVSIGGWELGRACFCKGATLARWPITVLAFGCYLILACGVLAFASQADSRTILFVYLTVAAFDGFSQVTGQLIGKHPLTPHISPHKTIEGTLGGLTAALIVALSLRSLPQLSPLSATALGGLSGLAGLGGDLSASWCKRRFGVKDFGRLLPGHGGVLDRFDSFLMAAAAFWLYSAYFHP